MVCHNNLYVYYKTIFALAQNHKYSLSDIDDLMPYERDIYVDLLILWLEDQKENNKQA